MKSILLAAAALSASAAPNLARGEVSLEFLGRYESGLEGAAEIVAYDSLSERLFLTNGATGAIDILDFSNPAAPALIGSIDGLPGEPTSVASARGLLAVAINIDDGASPGLVQFFNSGGDFLNSVEVGFLPDSLAFALAGKALVVANEGEPTEDENGDDIDPPGSVSVIDLSRGPRLADVCTADFSDIDEADLDASTRIFPGVPAALDLEPEFAAATPFGRKAYVSVQEANSFAEIDLFTCEITALEGLGFKDHSVPGQGLDASDEDGDINIQLWPVKGLYQPDGIAAFHHFGETFIVTANEGDDRGEEERIEDLDLDPIAFPNAAALQDETALGRLEVSTIDGDENGDGLFEELFAYGARSFSIYTARGEQVFDSGDDFEQITAALLPDHFNADDDSAEADQRSDNSGPEPEGVDVGWVRFSRLAFIGLERIGGVMVYDITKPEDPKFCAYENTRDFTLPQPNLESEIGPEGILFIPAFRSPTYRPLLVVSAEVSGTVAVFEVRKSGFRRCSGR